MNLQYISDTKGNPIGVFIPWQDWKYLKSKYGEIEQDELGNQEEPSWKTRIMGHRVKKYADNPDKVIDWDHIQKEIEGEYGF